MICVLFPVFSNLPAQVSVAENTVAGSIVFPVEGEGGNGGPYSFSISPEAPRPFLISNSKSHT